MEHGIIEQLQDSNLVAASTVKMLEIANTNRRPVYLANSANWSADSRQPDQLRPHLLSTFDLISQGYYSVAAAEAVQPRGRSRTVGRATAMWNSWRTSALHGHGMIIGGGTTAVMSAAQQPQSIRLTLAESQC